MRRGQGLRGPDDVHRAMIAVLVADTEYVARRLVIVIRTRRVCEHRCRKALTSLVPRVLRHRSGGFGGRKVC
jgi:hypothetical protein